jgi:hypothetical protein
VDNEAISRMSVQSVLEIYNLPVKIRMPMAMNATADRYFI